MIKERSLAVSLLVPVVVIAASLATAALWGDEVFSINFASSSLTALVSHLADDYHPPLYFLLLKAWIGLFGKVVFSLRMFQLVIGFGFVYWFTKIVNVIPPPHTHMHTTNEDYG